MQNLAISYRLGTQEDIKDMFAVEASSFKSRRLNTYLTSPNHKTILAVTDRQIIGYALLDFNCDKSHAFLRSLAVRPAFRGQGIATELLDWLEIEACQEGAFDLFLNVRSQNEEAKKFYANKGFIPINLSKDHYGNGQHATGMHKTLRIDHIRTFNAQEIFEDFQASLQSIKQN
jgi:[ribosomal protein S18]-alanine N-acetyltransferase